MSSRPPFSVVTALGAALTSALLVGATLAVLGVPDSAQVRAFWTGSRPSSEAALATSSALVWAAVLATSAWMTVGAGRALADGLARRRRARRTGAAVLVIGLVILAVGATRHESRADTLCCARGQEAAQALGH